MSRQVMAMNFILERGQVGNRKLVKDSVLVFGRLKKSVDRLKSGVG